MGVRCRCVNDYFGVLIRALYNDCSNDGAKETEIQSHDQESAHSGLFHRHAAGVVKDGDHEQRQEKNNSRNTDTQQQMKRTLGAIIVTLVAIIVLGTSTACFILILRQPGMPGNIIICM